MMIKATPFLLLIIIIIPGCIGPKYVVPHHPLPSLYTQQHSATSCENTLANWWYHFNDPLLNSLIEKAIANNYNLRIALERIEQARAFYQFKKAELFPQLDVVSQVSRTRFSNVLAQTSFLQNTNVSFFQLGFDGIWEIDVWGKIWRAKNARFFEFQAQIEQMRDIYLILLADVARTYVDLCVLQKRIHLLNRQIIIEKMLVALQTDLYNAGLSSEIELKIQQQQLATTQNTLKSLQTLYIQSHNQLGVLLGINPEGVKILPSKKIPLSLTELATGIPSTLLRRRPDIRKVERQLAAANELVGQAIAEWFPSFSLLGSIGSETSKGSDWFLGKSLTWSIGPSIRWPLINFGRIKAHIAERESIKRQAILEYSQTIIQALQEVEDFLAAYFNNKEQYNILKQKLEEASREQQLVNFKFKSGLSNQLAALQAEKNRIFIELEFTTAQQQLSINLIALYKALGGGW